MPELRTFEDYCIAVCREIRFSPDHASIAAELTDHLQEHMEALLEANPGMTPEEAQRQAIAAMGDPVALGHALDAVHNPRLGWFQIWFRRAVKLMTAVALLVALSHFEVLPPMFPEASHSLRQFYQGFDATVNYRSDLTFSARDYNVTVEEVIVLETSPTPTVVVLLRIPHTPWIREVEFTNWLTARDDLGCAYLSWEEYLVRRSSSSINAIAELPHCYSGTPDYTPFVSWYTISVHLQNPDARELTFTFDRFGEEISFTLPLRGGA